MTERVTAFLGETNLFEGRATRENGRLAVTDGDVRVRVAAGGFEGTVADGSTVAFTVRPERLSIAAEDGLERENTWTGTVVNAIYKGSNTLYEVDIGDRLLKVEQQRTRGVDLYDQDERVTVGFDDEDGEIIPESVTG